MKNTIIFTFLALLVFSACNRDGSPQGFDDKSSYVVDYESEGKALKAKQVNASRKIIKNAEIEIEVNDFKAIRQTIISDIVKYEAELFNETYSTSEYRLSGVMTLKVLPTNFNKLISYLESLAIVVHLSKSGSEDVTTQFLDVSTRLNTKRKMVAKYESYLKSAKNIEEMLKVEKELRKLIEEIEAKQTQLNDINNKVGQSTIVLSYWQNLPENTVLNTGPSFMANVGTGLKNGWGMVRSILLFLVNIWPILLISLTTLFFFRKRLSSGKTTNKVS